MQILGGGGGNNKSTETLENLKQFFKLLASGFPFIKSQTTQ